MNLENRRGAGLFPEIDKRKMGRRLKNLLKEKQITAKEIQEYLSLSCVQTVYRWMEGINIPCIDHLYALSVLMDISMDYLVTGEQWREKGSCGPRMPGGDLALPWDFILYENIAFTEAREAVWHRRKYLFLQGERKGCQPKRILEYLERMESFCAA